ncbi:PfkB family carbohydrate kinase [Herbaspirillum rubrisubalbicans]|uniref:PfkB family carbohydrate kinase n=1 Tax=Herbaspirillum rubrisubalbicans TaxID=80842 RepID=UPI0012FE4758
MVDTTAAGDSFGAVYLSALLLGKSVIDAAAAGHRLASTVTQYPGATFPEKSLLRRLKSPPPDRSFTKSAEMLRLSEEG